MQDIAACYASNNTMHDKTGKGKFSATGSYPVIGEQHRIYLRAPLCNWRKGERGNSPGGVMNVITRSLSDTEIDALADYISCL